MSCRAQAVRDVQALGHWPTFSPPGLPDGYAECLVCRERITAADLGRERCPGAAVKYADQLHAWRSVDESDDERGRTVAMVARCAEHQL